MHIHPWLNAPAWLPLVHALLHTLWQGALAAAGLFLVLRLLPADRANLRYGVALAALSLVLGLGVCSWALLGAPAPGGPRSPASPIGGAHSHPPVPLLTAKPPETSHTPTNTLSTAPTRTNAPPPGSPGAWLPLVTACWLLGVGLSLLRTVGCVVGAGRLRRRCQDLTDPHLLALAEELRGRLRLSRRVRWLVNTEINVPSTLGTIWPAVLLPASLLTGVPAGQLHAILAHELAHILRWDYLANLAQMLTEALLFFNPFVWWISRQVRVEREACCDQLAARECGSSVRYVEALVAFMEHSRQSASPTPLLAASGPGGAAGDNALERTRRLLVPGYRPALRLRWHTLVLVLTLSGSALSGLWLGTRAVAQTLRTTEQKPEVRQTDDKPAAARESTPYQVKVTTEDGLPLRENQAVFHAHHQFAQSGSWIAYSVDPSGSCTVDVPDNVQSEWLAATATGYAAVFAGPFTPPEMGKLNGLELRLIRGHTAAIEVVDEAGQPVPDAVITAVYPGPPRVSFGDVKTDASGLATLEHLAEAPLDVHVRAHGYQEDDLKNAPLDPAKPCRWTLKKASVLRGKVTAAATGRAIAGATIRLAYAKGASNEDYLWPGSGPVLATTDDGGGFTLDSLRPDTHYWFDVDAPGFGGAFVSDVTSVAADLNVALGEPWLIRGKVIHIPATALHAGKLTLNYGQTFAVGPFNSGAANRSVELTPDGEEATFVLGPFYQAYPEAHGTTPNTGGSFRWSHTSVSLSVGDRPAVWYVPGEPLPAGLVLDLADKPAPTPTPQPSPSLTTSPTAQVAATPEATPAASPKFNAKDTANAILAAARANEEDKLPGLFLKWNSNPGLTPVGDFIAGLLNELVQRRELAASRVLLDAMLQDAFTKDWKPGDDLLRGLVKDGRTDFLDLLLQTRRLMLDRLQAQTPLADAPTAAWITRRVTELTRERADVEALARAARDGDLAGINRSLNAGVDVDAVDQDDNTPLIEAVFKNRVEAARLLLERSAQVDKVRYPGWNYTPLCLCNSLEMAQLLKDHGANLHAKLWGRDTSLLVYVAQFAKADLVEWFLQQGLDPKMLGDNEQTLLFGLRDARTAQILLNAGVDPNHLDQYGAPALATAQSREVAQVLLDHGAKVNGFKDPLLQIMLTHYAAAGAVELVIQAGADHPHALVQWALIQATSHDDDLVGVLLRQGADPNEPTNWFQGRPDMKVQPLAQACANADNLKAVQALLDAGADPNAGKYPGILLKSRVRSGRSQELINLLLKGGARGVSELAFAVVARDDAKIRALLASAPTYRDNPDFWEEVLPSAARAGNLEVVKAALSKGASLALGQAVFGDDALSAAAGKAQVDILGLLLAARPPGSDPEELRSALRWATESDNRLGEPPHAEQAEQCAAMLLAAGAPVTGYEARLDPLVEAVFSRFHAQDLHMIERLVQAGADPNPPVSFNGEPQQRLLDILRKAVAQSECSTELVDLVARLSANARPDPGS